MEATLSINTLLLGKNQKAADGMVPLCNKASTETFWEFAEK